MIATLASAIMAYFEPVLGSLEALLVLLVVDVIAGRAAAVAAGEPWKMSKIRDSFVWILVVVAMLCAFFAIGRLSGNMEATIFAVQTALILGIWAFGSNILKNMTILSRNDEAMNKFFYALYTLLSLEVIRKLPFVGSITADDRKKFVEEQLKKWQGASAKKQKEAEC